MAAILMIASPAGFGGTGLYAGFSVGATDADVSTGEISSELENGGLANRTRVTEDSDAGFRVFAGYQFSEYVGIEGGYVNLGTVETRSDVLTPSGTVKTEVDLDGWTLALRGGYPFTDRFFAYAKIGAFFWTADGKATAALGDFAPITARDDEDGTDLQYGLGLSYAVTEQVAVRLDWDRYEMDDADVDVNLYSLGLQVSF